MYSKQKKRKKKNRGIQNTYEILMTQTHIRIYNDSFFLFHWKYQSIIYSTTLDAINLTLKLMFCMLSADRSLSSIELHLEIYFDEHKSLKDVNNNNNFEIK